MNAEQSALAEQMVNDFAATFKDFIATNQALTRKAMEGVKADLAAAMASIDKRIAEIPEPKNDAGAE